MKIPPIILLSCLQNYVLANEDVGVSNQDLDNTIQGIEIPDYVSTTVEGEIRNEFVQEDVKTQVFSEDPIISTDNQEPLNIEVKPVERSFKFMSDPTFDRKLFITLFFTILFAVVFVVSITEKRIYGNIHSSLWILFILYEAVLLINKKMEFLAINGTTVKFLGYSSYLFVICLNIYDLASLIYGCGRSIKKLIKSEIKKSHELLVGDIQVEASNSIPVQKTSGESEATLDFKVSESAKSILDNFMTFLFNFKKENIRGKKESKDIQESYNIAENTVIACSMLHFFLFRDPNDLFNGYVTFTTSFCMLIKQVSPISSMALLFFIFSNSGLKIFSYFSISFIYF